MIFLCGRLYSCKYKHAWHKIQEKNTAGLKDGDSADTLLAGDLNTTLYIFAIYYAGIFSGVIMVFSDPLHVKLPPDLACETSTRPCM